ncbi:MAG: signal peptidase I [Candidatus Babeliales bacterium]
MLLNLKNKIYELIKTLIIFVPLIFFVRTFLFGLYQVPTGSMEKTMLVGDRFLAEKLTMWFYGPERGDIITFNDAWQHTYSNNPVIRLFEHYVWGPSNWTKRVIGKPGDHVQGIIEDGSPVIYLNGEKLNEPYINPYPLIAVYTAASSIDSDRYCMRSYDPKVSFEDQPFYHMNPNDVQHAKQKFAHIGKPNILLPGTPVQARIGERLVDEFDVYLGPTQYWVMGDNRLGSADSRFYGPLDASFIHGKIIFRLWSLDSYESWWFWDFIKHPIDFWKRVRWSRFFQTL